METKQCKVTKVNDMLEDEDIIVTMAPISGNIAIPVITTTAFLTGIGENRAIEEIIEKVEI